MFKIEINAKMHNNKRKSCNFAVVYSISCSLDTFFLFCFLLPFQKNFNLQTTKEIKQMFDFNKIINYSNFLRNKTEIKEKKPNVN